MKLRIVILAIISSIPLLYGCGKEAAAVADNMQERRPIGFTASTSVNTKAMKPDDPSVLISEGNTARIFGVRVLNQGTPGETASSIFYNRMLSCDAVPDPATPALPYSSIWNYTPLEYWEDTGDYYFAGVFPSGTTDVSSDNVYIYATYLAGSNTDLMIARAYRNVEEVDGKSPVNLSFKHATSAVRFLFGKTSSLDSDKYSLTAFCLENLATGGSLKVLTRTTDASSSPISPSDWTPGASGELAEWNAATESERIDVNYPPDVDDPDGYTQMGWYYMVPQELKAESAIRFSIAYNNESPVETLLSLTDRDGIPGADSWLPNHVYNYYITITQSGLDLTVRAVPWDEVTVITDDMIFED